MVEITGGETEEEVVAILEAIPDETEAFQVALQWVNATEIRWAFTQGPMHQWAVRHRDAIFRHGGITR